MSIPVETAGASFAFATSVFTHLRAADAAHYLRELGRTLRAGGRLLMTAFLVDPAISTPPGKASPGLKFVSIDPETWTTDLRLPETAIGLAPDVV
jgi:ubiquinone/menaquinone biosynthesis C-methylase UbiE